MEKEQMFECPPHLNWDASAALIGRLGSICDSGEISPQPHHYMCGINSSAPTSCYTTPLNSPPKSILSMVDNLRAGGGLPFQGNPLLPPTHLVPFAADAGFTERAARFSCFSNGNYGGLEGQFKLPDPGDLPISLTVGGSQMGVAENKEFPLQKGSQLEGDIRSKLSTRLSRSSTPDDAESGGPREESPVAESAVTSTGAGNARKRKAVPKGKAKDILLLAAAGELFKIEEEPSCAKRSKSYDVNGDGNDDVKPKLEQNSNASSSDSGQKQGKKNNSKPPEPPKQDYIHVRARRGQATDSHSLAERVRREKISQRMKFLQDLVPGCSKVTGKAVMLDEIINYVQSLQRQVEFLSMKLATVNPRLDFNVESLLRKDVHQVHGSLPQSVYPLEASASEFPYIQQPPPQQQQQQQQQQHGTSLQNIVSNGLENHCSSDATLCRTQSMLLPTVDGFTNTASQLGTLWENDLQSVVQMGFGHSPETAFSSQNLHGSSPTAHMKIEL